MDKNLVFSLDIGTRTIIGIVGEYYKNSKIRVLASSVREHERRNMYDGQIHDIEGVTELVKEVVEDLEEQTNMELKVVSIAAAGRSLRTEKVFHEKDISTSRQIREKDVEILKLEAIQKAKQEIDPTVRSFGYYNIGHTVVDYYLNQDRMEKLEGHRGNKIGVELLATFLPQIVVESLYSVIEKAGLEIGSITLEPIAAINIAIKEELRLLNLALVDIGAGTSDIAITKGGQIIAYAMTSTAGDEITEELAREFLLDFNTSETLKVGLAEASDHHFTDVIGISHNMKVNEIVDRIQGIIKRISMEIGEKIVEYNGKAPSAIFLVGGSSKMPGLGEAIAKELGLSQDRVSIRDILKLKNVEGLEELGGNGPNMITPLGIALEGAREINRRFINLTFNGQEIKLLSVEETRVSDILVLTKFNPRKLLPQRAKDLIYYINGEKKIIKGKAEWVPQILINDVGGSLQTLVSNNDNIEIVTHSDEVLEEHYLDDLLLRSKYVFLEGRKINLIESINVNGNPVDGNIKILPNSHIITKEIKTLGDLVSKYSNSKGKFMVNGLEKSPNYLLAESDLIERIIENEKISKEGPVPVEETIIKRNEKQGNTISLIINGRKMNIGYSKDKFIFVDIFDHFDFDLSIPRGKLVLKVNGKNVGYMDALDDGDNIEVYWE